MPEAPLPPGPSRVPQRLEWGTLFLAFVAALAVYGLRDGWAWLPVLLVGAGTALVASAILLPGGPVTGHAWEWWRGLTYGHPSSGPVGGKPWRLYVGVWLILAGTAAAALIR
jgi:hypothetical protein